jgi:hypothetical protein
MASSKDYKTLLDLKEKATKEFISELSFVINALYSKNTNDNDFIFIKDGFAVAKNENPTVVLMVSGPYLWKYREQIENSNITFILQNDYETEIEEAKEKLQSTDKYNQIKDILKKIKSTWHLFSEPEQSMIIKKMQKLIISYATFVGAEKKMSAIKS